MDPNSSFYENFGTQEAAEAKAAEFKEAIETQQAINQIYDNTLAKNGINSSDRFNELDAAAQKKLVAEVQDGIDKVLTSDLPGADPAAKAATDKLGSDFRQGITESVPQIKSDAVVTAANSLASPAVESLGASSVTKTLNKVLIVDSNKIKSKGVFKTWAAVPEVSTEVGLMLNLTELPNGKTMFIMSVPNGRTNPLTGEFLAAKLTEANAAAAKTRTSGTDGKPMTPGTVFVRDSALQFSFDGLVLTKQEIIKVVAENYDAAEKAAKVPPKTSSNESDKLGRSMGLSSLGGSPITRRSLKMPHQPISEGAPLS